MKQKTKIFLGITLLACIVIFSCVSSGSGTGYTATTNGLSLDEAIEQLATEVVEKFDARTRVAIVAFSSEHDNLSNYIMDELTGAFVDGGLAVADRRNLAYVYRELNFQMSGDVSDETAVSIGKFLGARYVIIGQFVRAGNNYRYRLSGINVETTIQESSSRLNVRLDRTLQSLINDVKQTPINTISADYGDRQTILPKTAGEYLDRGILFASRGDHNMAITEFTEAIKLDGNQSSAYMLRGRALYASASYVTSVGENFSNVITTITNRNVSAERQVLYDRAIADFTNAIRLDQNSSHAYRERGVAYSDKGDQNRAIADLNQAIRLAPNYVQAYNNRGNVYRCIGDYDRAITDYNQAIRIDPNFARAYMNRGGAYSNKGDYNRAIADRTQAIRLAPNDAVIYNNRGGDYTNIGDYDRAIADYNQSIILDPNNSVTCSNRAYVYAHIGNYDRAIIDYGQAIRLDPNDAITYNSRGNVYFSMSDYTRAIADYEAALRIDPNNTTIKNNLENARRQRGR